MSGYQTRYKNTITTNTAGSTELNTALTKLVSDMVSTISKASPSIERYAEAIHPEEFTKSREVMRGLVPTLRPESVPYLLSASVFMALISIFIIFQMIGVSGQLNLPPAVLALLASPFGATPNTGTSISRGLLKYPKMVDILLVGVDSSYFIQFKTGMITQLAVDYTPNGVAVYKGESGAKPTFINITLSMKEAAIHTRDDYTGAESSNIVTGGAGGRNGF